MSITDRDIEKHMAMSKRHMAIRLAAAENDMKKLSARNRQLQNRIAHMRSCYRRIAERLMQIAKNKKSQAA